MQAPPVVVHFASQTVSFTPESAASVIKLAVSLLALGTYPDDVEGELSDSLLDLLSIELGNAGLDVPAMVGRIQAEWDEDAQVAAENHQAGPLIMLPSTHPGIFIGVPAPDLAQAR